MCMNVRPHADMSACMYIIKCLVHKYVQNKAEVLKYC